MADPAANAASSRLGHENSQESPTHPIETYRVIPKSAGLRISYVEGLARMALAWIPALWVKAQNPVM